MILASPNGMMASCLLVRETNKAWIINYNDKAFPNDQRVPKDGQRQVFKTVDEALFWMENAWTPNNG